jgi:hypothetical protein
MDFIGAPVVVTLKIEIIMSADRGRPPRRAVWLQPALEAEHELSRRVGARAVGPPRHHDPIVEEVGRGRRYSSSARHRSSTWAVAVEGERVVEARARRSVSGPGRPDVAHRVVPAQLHTQHHQRGARTSSALSRELMRAASTEARRRPRRRPRPRSPTRNAVAELASRVWVYARCPPSGQVAAATAELDLGRDLELEPEDVRAAAVELIALGASTVAAAGDSVQLPLRLRVVAEEADGGRRCTVRRRLDARRRPRRLTPASGRGSVGDRAQAPPARSRGARPARSASSSRRWRTRPRRRRG